MLKKIEVMHYNPLRSPRAHSIKIWAWVDGGLAIHRTLTEGGAPGYRSRPRLWSLTHLASGCCIGLGTSKREVVQRMRKVQRFRWHGIRPYLDMPTCELIQVMPEIAREFEYSDDDISSWTITQRPVIEEMQHCRERAHA